MCDLYYINQPIASVEVEMQKRLKAVIPVAGFRTRMLPAPRRSPEEMLPVVDKPLIQYIVGECRCRH